MDLGLLANYGILGLWTAFQVWKEAKIYPEMNRKEEQTQLILQQNIDATKSLKESIDQLNFNTLRNK